MIRNRLEKVTLSTPWQERQIIRICGFLAGKGFKDGNAVPSTGPGRHNAAVPSTGRSPNDSPTSEVVPSPESPCGEPRGLARSREGHRNLRQPADPHREGSPLSGRSYRCPAREVHSRKRFTEFVEEFLRGCGPDGRLGVLAVIPDEVVDRRFRATASGPLQIGNSFTFPPTRSNGRDVARRDRTCSPEHSEW